MLEPSAGVDCLQSPGVALNRIRYAVSVTLKFDDHDPLSGVLVLVGIGKIRQDSLLGDGFNDHREGHPTLRVSYGEKPPRL